MSEFTLDVETRDPAVMPARKVRKLGKIPGVFYAHGKESFPLQMDYQTFRRLFRNAGESSLIQLNIDGGKGKETVLVQDYTLDPVSDEFTHVDFFGVNLKEEIITNIPLELVGVSPAVKDLGGVLSQPLHTLEIKSLPGKIPHHIEVDISGLLDFHSSIHVSDLNIPEGVEVLIGDDVTVVTVAAPAKEEEEPVVEAAAEAPAAGEEKKEGEGKE